MNLKKEEKNVLGKTLLKLFSNIEENQIKVDKNFKKQIFVVKIKKIRNE